MTFEGVSTMYGIVEINGHQYQVKPGVLIDVDKMGNDIEEGSMVNFENVLFIGGTTPLVGLPTVTGAKVQAKIIRHAKSRKLIVFKRKAGQWQKRRADPRSRSRSARTAQGS